MDPLIDDMASISDRSHTPLLSLEKSQGPEVATDSSVQQGPGSEKQSIKEVVETLLMVAHATRAVGDLPLPEDDKLGEPASQNSPENVDPDNAAI